MIEYINQTLINQWIRCPEQVRRRWFCEDIIPPGIAASIGTGLHKGAEVNHKAKMVTGKDEPLDVVQDAARDGYIKAIQDGVFFPPDRAPSARNELSAAIDTTVSLARLYWESLAPKIVPVLVEKKIVMPVSDITFPFIGTIDIYTADKWLPDIKTAAKKWPQNRANNSVQATLYNELVKYETGEYPQKLSFEVFTKTKKKEHQSVETSRSKNGFKILSKRVKLMLSCMQAGIFQPADPESWMCSWNYCGYFLTCPYISPHRKILPKRSK